MEHLINLFCNNENAEKFKNSNLIKPFLNETGRMLSSGEVRLLEVLLVIYSSTEIILLDEPFNNLSPKIVSIVKDLIKEQSHFKGFIIYIRMFWIFLTKFTCYLTLI